MDIIYHQVPVEQVITTLKTNANGLTNGEVIIRQKVWPQQHSSAQNSFPFEIIFPAVS